MSCCCGPSGSDTFVTFVDNGDGSVTFTPADGGDPVTVGGPADTFVTIVDNGDGTGTITPADGGPALTFCLTCSDPINLVYVAYDETIHVDGQPVVGDGTTGAPYQIVLPPGVEFTYVLYDDAVHDDGTIVGDGSTGSPYEIPIKPCTKTYIEGDVVAYDVTLADGTVIAAGDPIPPGWIVINEENPFDGTFIEGNSHGPTTWVYVEYDDTVHVDGQAPAGTGTTTDPYQIPLPADLCDTLAALDPADCTTGPFDLVTADCEIISSGDLANEHVLAACTQPEQPVGPLNPAIQRDFGPMVEQDRNQIGAMVVGTDNSAGITAADQIPETAIDPLVVTLPPSTPGCVQFVQITYGASGYTAGEALHQPQNPLEIDLVGFSGDVADAQYINDTGAWTSANLYSAHQYVFASDVTGSNGGTMSFDFPARPPSPDGLYEGVLNWVVYEVCGTNISADAYGAPIETTASIAPGTGGVDIPNPAPAIDAGTCDAVYFGVSRHAFASLDDNSVNTDSDWSQFANTSVNEATDLVSYNSQSFCQLGVTAGQIPGGSGPVTFEYFYNSQSALPDNYNGASWFALPLADCDQTAELVAETACCTLDLTNPNCTAEAILEAQISGVMTFVVGPGNTYTVTPLVNGVPLTQYTQTVASPLGASGDMTESVNLGFNYVDPNVIAADGGTGTIEVCWQVTFDGPDAAGDSVILNGSTIDGQLTHI